MHLLTVPIYYYKKIIVKSFNGNKTSEEFLSIQAEMLTSKATGFRGLIIYDKLGDGKSAGVYDQSDQKIHIPIKKFREDPLCDTLSHEMTHTIYHIYDVNSEEKVLGVLRFLNDTEKQQDVMSLVADSFTPHKVSSFREGYMNPAFRQKLELSKACMPILDTDPHDEVIQKQKVDTLASEVTSFAYESIFHEINNPKKGANFLRKYKELRPNTEVTSTSTRFMEAKEKGEGAQEIIAVAIFDINMHMIEHIKAVGDITPERAKILSGLEEIRRVITPANVRGIEKISGIGRTKVPSPKARFVSKDSASHFSFDGFCTPIDVGSRSHIYGSGNSVDQADKIRVSLSTRRASIANLGKEMIKHLGDSPEKSNINGKGRY